MREALLILLVILVLLGLTAYRYRRGLYSAYLIWLQLKEIRGNISPKEKSRDLNPEPASGGEMVSCAKCGKWTPSSSAITIGGKRFYCSQQCFAAATTVN